MFLNVRKMRVNERTLNMRYSIYTFVYYAFNVRLTCV